MVLSSRLGRIENPATSSGTASVEIQNALVLTRERYSRRRTVASLRHRSMVGLHRAQEDVLERLRKRRHRLERQRGRERPDHRGRRRAGGQLHDPPPVALAHGRDAGHGGELARRSPARPP